MESRHREINDPGQGKLHESPAYREEKTQSDDLKRAPSAEIQLHQLEALPERGGHLMIMLLIGNCLEPDKIVQRLSKGVSHGGMDPKHGIVRPRGDQLSQ